MKMIGKNKVKVYIVSFNYYSDDLTGKTTVSNGVYGKDSPYISETVSDEYLGDRLIYEDELDYFQQLGKGINSIKLVGWVYK